MKHRKLYRVCFVKDSVYDDTNKVTRVKKTKPLDYDIALSLVEDCKKSGISAYLEESKTIEIILHTSCLFKIEFITKKHNFEKTELIKIVTKLDDIYETINEHFHKFIKDNNIDIFNPDVSFVLNNLGTKSLFTQDAHYYWTASQYEMDDFIESIDCRNNE